jgi:putative transposase
MPRTIYAEINLHITWHTKQSVPVINEAIENRLYHYLQHRIVESDGGLFHAIGGTGNHIHLVVSILPTLNISNWIGELKGASAYYINHQIANRKLLEWQSGYGVVSFGTKDMQCVINYVLNQKQHHARGSIHDRLERTEG